MSNALQKTILLSQFFIVLALEITNPYLPLLIATITDTSKQAIIFYSTCALVLPMVATMLMAPLWGILADRMGYKPMLMRASWTLVLTQASMMLVHSVAGIVTIKLIQGAFAGYLVAMQTYALTLCSPNEKSKQLSKLQASKGMATALAGLVGGIVLSQTSFQILYGVSTLMCILITFIMQQKLPAIKPSLHQSNTSSDAYLFPKKNQGVILFLCVLITLAQLIRFLPDPAFSLLLNEQYPEHKSIIGLFYSLPAIGLLLGATWCGRQFDNCRSNSQKVNQYLLSYSALGIILMLAHAFIVNLYLLALIRIIWGIVLSALLPALYSLVTDRIQKTGSALGVANAFTKLGNLLGLLLGGAIASATSFYTFFLIMACLYALFAMFVLSNFILSKQKTLFLSHHYKEQL